MYDCSVRHDCRDDEAVTVINLSRTFRRFTTAFGVQGLVDLVVADLFDTAAVDGAIRKFRCSTQGNNVDIVGAIWFMPALLYCMLRSLD